MQVPLSGDRTIGSGESTGWGQTCGDVEIWLHGTRMTDVKLEIQAFREDYMIATASSRIEIPFST